MWKLVYVQVFAIILYVEVNKVECLSLLAAGSNTWNFRLESSDALIEIWNEEISAANWTDSRGAKIILNGKSFGQKRALSFIVNGEGGKMEGSFEMHFTQPHIHVATLSFHSDATGSITLHLDEKLVNQFQCTKNVEIVKNERPTLVITCNEKFSTLMFSPLGDTTNHRMIQ